MSPDWYEFVPSDQPVNVYPVLLKVFAGSTNVAPLITVVGETGALPIPPPALYEIV